MGTLWQDVRYGLRILGRNRGFTVCTVLTLALGVGATGAIFGVVNAVLLRPLPFQDPEQLVYLRVLDTQTNASLRLWSGLVTYWREYARSYSALATLKGTTFHASGGEFPELISGYQVSPNVFALTGVEPLLGRTFVPEDAMPGGERVVVLSYGLWQRRFGGDVHLIGKSITLNDVPHTVVGVMPREFVSLFRAEIWQACVRDSDDPYRGLHVIGRLKPHINRRQAQAEAAVLSRQFGQQDPDFRAEWLVRVESLRDVYVEGTPQFSGHNVQRSLWVLLAATGLLLAIVGTNVASLQCARARTRQQELSVRIVLGAGRRRLMRQYLMENLLLAILGAAFGVLVSRWMIGVLTPLIPPQWPGPHELHVDAWILGFSLVVAALTSLVAGVFPAWHSTRSSLAEALREGSGRSLGDAGGHLFRSLLIASEAALTLVLLVGAGLMVRSAIRLLHVDPGFDSRNLMCAEIGLPAGKDGHSDNERSAQRREIYEQIVERVGALPGVISTAASFGLNWGTARYMVEGQPDRADLHGVACTTGPHDCLRTMKIPLLQGRYFTDDDVRGEAAAILVTESLARKLWLDEPPIGKRIRASATQPWLTVVGVVQDARLFSYAEESAPTFYQLLDRAQLSIPDSIEVIVRTRAAPATLANAIRREVQSVEKDLPVRRFWEFETRLAETGARRRFCMILLSIFASVAVLLCAVGIYGVLSYAVARRTREIGVRMALGAGHRAVLWLIIRQVVTWVALGSTAGIVAALALTRFVASQLYGVTPVDPPTFVGASLLLLMVALLACYLPARRAARVDPMAALRCE
jgi:putative ABC transport system permease protein